MKTHFKPAAGKALFTLLFFLTGFLIAQTCPDDVGGTKYYIENDPSIDSRGGTVHVYGENLIVRVYDPGTTTESFVKLAPDGTTSPFTFPDVTPRTNDDSDNFEYFQLENGNIVMCWYSPSAGKGFTDIYFKIVDASGNEVRSATKINTLPGELNRFPEIEQLSNGNIIFVWATSGVDYSMRRFSQAGTAVDANQISLTDLAGLTGSAQYDYKVAANEAGKFMVFIRNASDNYYGMIFNDGSDTPNQISGSNYFLIPAGGSTVRPYVETLANNQFLLVYRVQTGATTDTRSIAYKIYNDDGSVALNQVIRRELGSSFIQEPLAVENGFYLSYRKNSPRVSYLEFFDNSGNFISDHSACVPEFSTSSFVRQFIDVDGNISYVVNAVESGTDRNIWVLRQSSVLGTGNTPPTASSFTANPYEGLTYTFNTSDFGYADTDGDILDYLVIETLPSAGTLYLDTNENDLYDSGEEIPAISQIGKLYLDDGSLQYIQNGSVNSSFQFRVNDSAEDSPSYTATLNVLPKPAITIADVSGNEDDGVITLTATLSTVVGDSFTVDINSTDGTAATADSDYAPIMSQTLTFNGTAGETQTFTITPGADTKLEADETITISQGNLSGTSLDIDITDTAIVTLLNDDTATVTIADASGYEDDGSITVTATLDNAVQGGFSMIANRLDMTARMDSGDYGPRGSATLTFVGLAGETQTLLVSPHPDTTVEADETMKVSPSNLSGTSLPVRITDSGIVTILNDDSSSIIIEDVSGIEDNGVITLEATLENSVEGDPFTVDISTIDVTATIANNDYTPLSNHTLTFSGNSGEIQTFTVLPTQDSDLEADETLKVVQSNLDGTAFAIDISDEAFVTILNDDTPPVITANQSFEIDENFANGTLVGTVEVTDADAGTTFSGFTISTNVNPDGDGENAFNIDALTGDITVNDTDDLDYELNPILNIYVYATDGTISSANELVEIKLNDLDDTAPVVVTNTGIDLNEGNSEIIDSSELLATDTDTDDNLLIYEITGAPSNGRVELSTNSGLAITSFSQSQLLANQVLYTHDGSEAASDSFSFNLTDGSGNSLTSQNFSITISGINDDPVINNLKNDVVSYTEGGMPVNIDAGGDALVTDPDMNGGELNFLFYSSRNFSEDQLGIDTSGDVQLINSGGRMEVEVGGVRIGYTTLPGLGYDLIINLYPAVTDDLLTKLVRSLTYENVNTENPDATPRKFYVNLSDGNGGATASMDIIFTVNIEEVNDDPSVNGIPTDLSVEEEQESLLQLGDVEIADPDSENGVIDLYLEVDLGILTAISEAGVSITNSGTTAIILSGTVSDINSYLDANSVKYKGPSDLTGDNADLLSFSARDNGNTGDGGNTLINFGSTNIDINDINDAPEITLPVNFMVFEDAASPIKDFSIADIDAGSATIELQIEVARGILEATNSSGISVSGSGSSILILQGSVSALNSFIASEAILYTTEENDVVDVRIDFVVNDLGNTGSGGSQLASQSAIISISEENDAPVVNVPGTQTVIMNNSLQFNAVNANLILLEDIDAGNSILELKLTTTNGSLSLGSVNGLTFISGDGSNDNLTIVEGKLSDLNEAINNLTFLPETDHTGTAEIAVELNDMGNTGSGIALSDRGIVIISIESGNPLVELVTSDNADGLYGIGDILSINVKFDQTVLVAGGSPRLLLETGDSDRYAIYDSGSGTNMLSFTYQIQEGDFNTDLGYANFNALEFNGATIQNSDGTSAILDLPVPGAATSLSFEKDLIVDGVKPVVVTNNISVTLDELGKVSVTAEGIDNESYDNLTSMANLAISIDRSDFDCSDVGGHTIALTITDEAGNRSSANATVNVQDNISPTVLTKNITIELDENGMASINPEMIDNGSADICGLKPLRLNTLDFDCSNIGENTVQLEVEDINGNIGTGSATVTVLDKIAPVPMYSALEDIVVFCQLNEEDLIIPTASDMCDGTIRAYHDITFPVTELGVTQIIWTYEDSSGNKTTQIQNVTIQETPLSNIIFDSKTFTFDGSSKSIFIENLPEDVVVRYEGNAKINAGTYEVSAFLSMQNCNDLELKAMLEIEKAEQEISFPEIGEKDLAINTNFFLSGTSSSVLPVFYTFSSEDNSPAATVSSNGYVRILEEGEITITAYQEGNNNFEPAEPVTRTLIVSNSLVEPTIAIGDNTFQDPEEDIFYLIECGNNQDEVVISIDASENVEIMPGRSFNISIPGPGIYSETVEIYFNGDLWKTYTITIEKQFDFENIVVQKFNNVLMVNNNPSTNGGYTFTDYKWYKNSQFIGRGQYYSAGDDSSDELDPEAEYEVILETSEGEELRTCVANISLRSTGEIQIAPSPVRAGSEIEIRTDFSPKEMEEIQFSILNLNGKVIKRMKSSENITKIQIPAFAQKGVYLLVCQTRHRKVSVKFIVR
ncbi:cadherin-like domain-containing protein [Gramella sp. KN1008]|uniref:cadherin-like domain-containing protein n=1 Tax=Gramella sp. KN1008 TaxID=2529298 RepID=UPI00103E5C67|nr:cadherin-like domain-containing protein [Gramella sp. KN1008]TBW25879.1 T9SS type A sorting domain-containing protein [Gramella sp. KN1008]